MVNVSQYRIVVLYIYIVNYYSQYVDKTTEESKKEDEEFNKKRKEMIEIQKKEKQIIKTKTVCIVYSLSISFIELSYKK